MAQLVCWHLLTWMAAGSTQKSSMLEAPTSSEYQVLHMDTAQSLPGMC